MQSPTINKAMEILQQLRSISEGTDSISVKLNGIVQMITETEGPEELGLDKQKFTRVSVFMSVFNVHVNRAPADLEVVSVVYREGRYLDARSAGCVTENEAMTIAGTATAAGQTFPMGIRQISGAIARRIVCPMQPERRLRRGEIYGMIKFGSRTELYLPLEGVEVRVRPGDRVYGGKTVIAAVRHP